MAINRRDTSHGRRNAALTTVRCETPPDRQLQANFVFFVVMIGGERLRVHLAVLMDGDGRLAGSDRGGSGWISVAKDGTIYWYLLLQDCRPIRHSFEATLHRVMTVFSSGDETAPQPPHRLRQQG